MSIKIGILGLADIAYNRFLPSLMKSDRFECKGVARFKNEAEERASRFVERYNLHVYPDYESLLADSSIEAVYLPLPPARHCDWAVQALEAGKHILLEKPFTTKFDDSQKLIEMARAKNLAVHENYMFVYHSQIEQVKAWMKDETFGPVRLLRAAFGFPLRQADDFRYKKELGGGALLDAAGYVIQLAQTLMDEPELCSASMEGLEGYEVDMFGSASLKDKQGLVCQGAWGMSNFYQCALEIWCRDAKVSTNRIFTSPDGYQPSYTVERQGSSETLTLPADDHFLKSIEYFADLVAKPELRAEREKKILNQAKIIDEIRKQSTMQ